MKCGTNRAAAYASSMGSPEEFIAYAEEMAAAHGRKYETYNLVLAGDPKVFDANRPEDLKNIINHDDCTGKALKRNTSWTRGLRQLNDELLVKAGYEPNAEPRRLLIAC